jgi:hypothetical protein
MIKQDMTEVEMISSGKKLEYEIRHQNQKRNNYNG